MGQEIKLRKNRNKPHGLIISIMFTVCTILYYLPAIIGFGGGITTQNTLNGLHNFYGLDFYAVIFFIPVVYAAYSIGVVKAVLVALASMIVFTPYSLFITEQPGALFRPTAFVLILSAVGAVVAMLQRGDEQRKRNLNEMKCLYDIGKAAMNCDSVDKFLASAVTIIPQNLNWRGEMEFCITLRGKTYHDSMAYKSPNCVSEELMVGGEASGTLSVAYPSGYPWDKKSHQFIQILAERIGGAVHSIELEQSLKVYYEQLEVMVEARTRELEKAQEKIISSERLAAVGELASGVGHELRNPLNVIRNCVYLINMGLDGNASAEVLDTLKLLDLQVDISNKIVGDLLDFTRVKSPNRSVVNLRNMIQDRVAWASVPNKIDVRYDFAEENPELYIDPEQVGRAFTNIISNAVQSITNDGVFNISTGKDGDYGWVKFADSGCGISKENLSKIFEPLFTTKPKGIGLGLAITKRMVEQNGGEITVESTVGKGTTFTIKLPLMLKEVTQHEPTGMYSGS